MPGKMIVIDGADGSGKSTLWTLADTHFHLKGVNMRCFRHPGATKLGAELRRLVKSTEFAPNKFSERLMFMADYVQFCEEQAKPLLESGVHVLNDRGTPITDFVYGRCNGVPLEFYEKLYSLYEPPVIDLAIIIKVNNETAIERKGRRDTDRGDRCRIEEKGIAFLNKVNEMYASLDKPGLWHHGELMFLSRFFKKLVIMENEGSIETEKKKLFGLIEECIGEPS